MAGKDEAGRADCPGWQVSATAVSCSAYQTAIPIAPDVLTKWYRMWRAEHPEFEKIVFHGLRHSSATYQLLAIWR